MQDSLDSKLRQSPNGKVIRDFYFIWHFLTFQYDCGECDKTQRRIIRMRTEPHYDLGCKYCNASNTITLKEDFSKLKEDLVNCWNK